MFLAGSLTAARLRPPALAICAGACLAAAGCGPRPGGDPLVLGLTVPLTDGGGAEYAYGVRSRRGAELAVEEINRAGGIGGRPLALRVVDYKASPEWAIAVADSLVNDPRVLAVVGPVDSGATIKGAGAYDGRLPAIATTATSPDVSLLGPWIYRMASSDSVNAVSLANMARSTGRRIGVLYANNDYGQGLARSFIAALKKDGVAPVSADPFMDDTGDFTPYLRRMQRRGVDLVFLAGLEAPAARAITQAQDLGMQARFVGGDAVEGLAGLGPRFDGVAVGLLFHPQMSDSARAFAARFRARHGGEPDSQAALTYDAVRLLARALADGRRNPESIRGYLEHLGQDGGPPAFEGVAGRLAFDRNGDPVDNRFTLGVIQGGRIVLPGGAR